MSTAVRVTTPQKGVIRLKWEELAANQQGDAGDLGRCRHKIVAQISGTFNTETVTIEGSVDGTVWGALTTNGTDAATATANDVINIWEAPNFIRPSISDGTGVDVDVVIEGIAWGD